MSEDRLARMEKKLDNLTDALVTLVRMEERMVTLFKRMDSYDENQREIGQRMRTLEGATSTNGQMLRFAERIFWIVATAAVGFFFLRNGG